MVVSYDSKVSVRTAMCPFDIGAPCQDFFSREGAQPNFNNIGQPNQRGATLIPTLSFISKVAFYIHNFGEQEVVKKLKIPTILKT